MRDEQIGKGNLEREVPLQPGCPGQVPRSIRQGEVRARIDRHLGIHLRGGREEGVRGRPGSSSQGQGDSRGEGEDGQGRRADARAPSPGGPCPAVMGAEQGCSRPAPAREAALLPRPSVHQPEEQDTRGAAQARGPQAGGVRRGFHEEKHRVDALAAHTDGRFLFGLPGERAGADRGDQREAAGGVRQEAGGAADSDDPRHRLLRRPAHPRGDRRHPSVRAS